MKTNLGLQKENSQFDEITTNMQKEIILISENKLKKKLSKFLIEKIRNNPRSYIALEIILDSVKSLETDKLEDYLNKM